MAQLVWRPVEAQQGTTRDLALAGATIGNSFDRMAQMLVDRETRLRQEATDESAAGVLLAGDEAGVDAAAAAALAPGGNKRINRRVVAELANAQKSTVLAREGVRQSNTLGRETIADKQGANSVAGIAPRWLELLGSGDPNQVSEANAEIAAVAGDDPGAARGIRQLLSEMRDAREFGITERRSQIGQDQEHTRGLATIENQSRQVSLQEQAAAEARKRQADTDAGMILATEFAGDSRLVDSATAKAKLYENPRFLTMLREEPAKARAVLENFDTAHGALTAETSDIKAGFKPVDTAIAAQTTALTAAANRAENQTRTPEVQAARRALGNDGKVSANDVMSTMAKLGPYFNESTAASDYQYVMENVKGARPEDVDAAIEQFGMASGWWTKHVLPTNMDDVLKANVQKIVDARNQGYTQNADLDVAVARQPFESKAAEMSALRAEMTRYARAAANGTPLTPEQQETYRRAEARLVELASGKSK